MVSVYIYDWSHQYVSNKIIIRAFSMNEHNQTVSLIIKRFCPWLYIELLDDRQFTDDELDTIKDYLCNHVFKIQPTSIEVESKYKLYYVQSHPSQFLKCSFPTDEHFKYIERLVRKKHTIEGIGSISFDIHEHRVSPILQFICSKDISMSGWISFEGKQIPREKSFTNCDEEYIVSQSSIRSCSTFQHTPAPIVLSFDIEVYSSNPNRFPIATDVSNPIFQISCVFWSIDGSFSENVLLTIGTIDERIVKDTEEVRCISCSSEPDLLDEFIALVEKYNPHLITGWNILNFDIDYIIKRCEIHSLERSISHMGMIRNKECTRINDTWSSSAYGSQSFSYYNWDGRIVIDLLVFARREIKSENYKLNTIASMFVNTHKDPLTHLDIFKGYQIGVLEYSKYGSEGTQKLSEVGKYCMKDSILVQKLFMEFDMWLGITEMSAVCNVPSSYLYTKGQQIKVFSQVYRYCCSNNIVVQRGAYKCKSNERYQGAYVKDPEPGIYKYIVPMDFASLYPTIIVAYNIDYSTLVMDDSIPDERCHIIEWEEEHLYDIHPCKVCGYSVKGERSSTHNKLLTSYSLSNLECGACNVVFSVTTKDIVNYPDVVWRGTKFTIPSQMMTDTYRYRFIKDRKGVLPVIIQNLLSARKQVRKQIKDLKSDPTKKNLVSILNKRQLSYKVSANSMYGALGVREGILPLMPGAMCITALGRMSLHKAAKHLIDRYNVKWVYSDTDSTYVQFPNLAPDRIWEYAKFIEEEMVREEVFPKPMVLEFEEAVYYLFLILTKKRYMWRNYNRDGSISHDIGNKGVVLARRGSSLFFKKMYETVVQWIFESKPLNDILDELTETLNQCCRRGIPIDEFVITKQVGDIDTYDESRSLPAHMKVAELIQKRGFRVDTGQRLEYVVTTKSDSSKIADKAEDVNYCRQHGSILKVDYLYYIHLVTKQVDELLFVVFNIPDFMSRQYELRVSKYKMMKQLVSYFQPKIEFVS